MSDDRLLLSYFTLARDHPLDDRIAAAGEAGFDGIGLFAGFYRHLLDHGWNAARVHDLLDRHGVVVGEAEALSGWGAREPSAEYLDFEAFLWTMVDEFSIPYVQAIGPTDGHPLGTVDDDAERFAALCDRAAEHGATVGLEFLPFTNVADAAHALAIVEAADRPNGGVCVDVWHHARGANDLDLLRALPAERIVGVQVNDGPTTPTLDDYKQDCLRHRVPPGHGDFDVDVVIGILLDKGLDPVWDLEVCNEHGWTPAGARDHVHACATAMRETLERVRSAT